MIISVIPHSNDYWRILVNIGPGHGLVPSGYKPWPEPMMTKICVTLWCH